MHMVKLLIIFNLIILSITSSPHLVEVRERIRINGRPISKEMFAKYFFDCFDNLQNSKVSVSYSNFQLGEDSSGMREKL